LTIECLSTMTAFAPSLTVMPPSKQRRLYCVPKLRGCLVNFVG
jgi:hypothetical protein